MICDCSADNCTSIGPLNHDWAPKHSRRLLRILHNVEFANVAGLQKRRDFLIKLYLRSRAAKEVAALEANRHLKPRKRLSKDELRELARRLDAWKGTAEPVSVKIRVKPNGDGRPIANFGPEHRALQYLVRPLLRATAILGPNQFAIKGGTHAAILRAASALAEGFRWGFHMDIQNCFPSFQGEATKTMLALPKEVTERTILSRHFTVVFSNLEHLVGSADGGLHEPWLALVRSGIPQGSAASNWVCEIAVSHIIRALPYMSGALIINFADNILILAKSKAEAVAMRLALRDAMSVGPAGPFQPTVLQEFSPSDRCDFLGHSLWSNSDAVCIDVDDPNLQKFQASMQRFMNGVRTATGPIFRKRRLREALSFLKSWSGAFKLCASAPSLAAQWAEVLSHTASKYGV